MTFGSDRHPVLFETLCNIEDYEFEESRYKLIPGDFHEISYWPHQLAASLLKSIFNKNISNTGLIKYHLSFCDSRDEEELLSDFKKVINNAPHKIIAMVCHEIPYGQCQIEIHDFFANLQVATINNPKKRLPDLESKQSSANEIGLIRTLTEDVLGPMTFSLAGNQLSSLNRSEKEHLISLYVGISIDNVYKSRNKRIEDFSTPVMKSVLFKLKRIQKKWIRANISQLLIDRLTKAIEGDRNDQS